MHIATLITLLPALALAAPATKRDEPAPLLMARDATTAVAGKYIVKFRENSASSILEEAMKLIPGNADHTFKNIFKGFASRLDEKSLAALRAHPDVEYIEQDSQASAVGYVTQSGSTWGLSRISHYKPGSPDYVYDSSGGQGTCAYIVDSGIDVDHPEFEGRAFHAGTFVGNQYYDDFGHGTHCAGTVGSRSYGVAKKTTLYNVKVLNNEGKADFSTIIAGLDFVPKDASKRNCPNGVVVNVSIGGGYSQAANDAVTRLARNGYFVGVAAGNDNANAANYSPASAEGSCTVGGTAKYDTRYTGSNFGPNVDILGPAVDVYSTLPGGGAGYKTGTSMATPHVVGLAAYLAARDGKRASPALCKQIQDSALRNMITDQPSNTVNLLAFNGNPSG